MQLYWEFLALGSWCGNCPELQGLSQVNMLEWSTFTEAVHKKGLRPFQACKRMLQLFYQSAVGGAIFFAVVCDWLPGALPGGAEEQSMLTRLRATMEDMSGSLHHTVDNLQRSISNRLIRSWTNLQCICTSALVGEFKLVSWSFDHYRVPVREHTVIR